MPDVCNHVITSVPQHQTLSGQSGNIPVFSRLRGESGSSPVAGHDNGPQPVCPENAAAGDNREDLLKNGGESESAAVPGNDMGADVSSDSSEEDMSSYLFDDSISVEIGDFLSEGPVRNGEDAASGNENGN